MAEDKNRDRDGFAPDEAKYRKKRPQTSKTQKRANHKHQYQKIIVQTIVGWDWGQCCTICGRISYKFALSSSDFMRPERTRRPCVSRADFYDLEELLTKFPGVPVYLYNDRYELEKYEKGQ